MGLTGRTGSDQDRLDFPSRRVDNQSITFFVVEPRHGCSPRDSESVPPRPPRHANRAFRLGATACERVGSPPVTCGPKERKVEAHGARRCATADLYAERIHTACPRLRVGPW